MKRARVAERGATRDFAKRQIRFAQKLLRSLDLLVLQELSGCEATLMAENLVKARAGNAQFARKFAGVRRRTPVKATLNVRPSERTDIFVHTK